MRRVYRKICWAGALLLAGMIMVLGVVLLYQARLGPFATGSREQAFLGTTFKMSPPEVRRALKKYGGQLTTYESYRAAQMDPAIEQFNLPSLFAEYEGKETFLYMPGIQMYDSRAEAEFVFWDEQLDFVSVHFVPISKNIDPLIATLEQKLRDKYKFVDREESKYVPGAYSLHFASQDVEASLWVNQKDRDKPIVSVTLISSWQNVARRARIKQREETAFGATK